MKNAKPTPMNAILAQCHECLGRYADGKSDCENTKCSLYAWMPYRKLEPDMSWTEIHPKRIGIVKFADVDTAPNENTLAALKKSRENRSRIAENEKHDQGHGFCQQGEQSVENA